jgi:hypothetical protein
MQILDEPARVAPDENPVVVNDTIGNRGWLLGLPRRDREEKDDAQESQKHDNHQTIEKGKFGVYH